MTEMSRKAARAGNGERIDGTEGIDNKARKGMGEDRGKDRWNGRGGYLAGNRRVYNRRDQTFKVGRSNLRQLVLYKGGYIVNCQGSVSIYSTYLDPFSTYLSPHHTPSQKMKA